MARQPAGPGTTFCYAEYKFNIKIILIYFYHEFWILIINIFGIYSKLIISASKNEICFSDFREVWLLNLFTNNLYKNVSIIWKNLKKYF